MATIEKSTNKSQQPSAAPGEQNAVEKLGEALEKTELQEDDSSLAANVQDDERPSRPLHVYKRPELLFLSKSPLVGPPDGMPPLKDWFGDWNEQIGTKKEAESSATGINARDRRFRRDVEEGEAPTRLSSFKPSTSQPSQMGNFRHQSLRTTERERDRESERERQRDERDREGQERLRNLSDKYDRDRLAASSNSASRGKDRDPAPHLMSGSASRGAQGQNGTTTRRTDTRDAGRKKAGEASDDWRRVPETSRTTREERSDAARRDRDRPRSRIRDSSRSRRDPSNSRKDRDREDRDRPRRRDDPDDDESRDLEKYWLRRDWDIRHRTRDMYLRDHADRHSRDEDQDTDEDPRRWRDDGRRDERQSLRRERERDRNWDRWEPSHDRERVDDRDGRPKRAAGRDKRSSALDDPKEKDERKEKEPAWMETYVPTTPGGGILGGRGAEGELDGIQAWKKGMKEREKKIQDNDEGGHQNDAPPVTSGQNSATVPSEDQPLDEIQMFKLMMKKEAARKESDNVDPEAPLTSEASVTVPKDDSAPQAQAAPPAPEAASRPVVSTAATASNDGTRLLSLLSQAANDHEVLIQPTSTTPLSGTASSDVTPAVSRFFPTPSAQVSEKVTIDLSGPTAPNHSFNPPAGSRLLAFGSRAVPPNVPASKPLHSEPPLNASSPFGMLPSKFGGMTPPPPGINVNLFPPGLDVLNPLQSEPQFVPNSRATPSDRSGRSYSPFNLSARQAGLDDIHDGVRLSPADPLGRPIIVPHPERSIIGTNSEVSSPYAEQGGSLNFPLSPSFEHNGTTPGSGSSAGKGSRFAKFFDAKNREPQSNVGTRRTPVQPGLVPTPPPPGHGGIHQSVAENRAMEDLFAMLQNSTQNHRASPQLQGSNRIPSGASLYGQGSIDIQALQQQQHFAHQNARLDSLYDSRLDDRNFVPDGLVPGLRPAPRPRSREPTGVLFNEQLDDPLHFNAQRIQQQRALEQLYSGQAQTFNQPGLNRGGITLQQAQLREIQLREAQIREAHLREVQLREAAALREAQIREAQLRNQQGPPQRLPPGLANLGARPPHDPTQYLNSQVSAAGGLLPTLQQGGPVQQRFESFGGAGNFNGPNSTRGPVPGPQHQNIAFNHLNGLSPANANVDIRNPNQQLLGLGAGVVGGNPRGLGPGFPQHQQVPIQLAPRQQQQHFSPQHNMIPPHIQHQPQNIHVGNTQGTADLMALLMGGPRE